MKKTSAILLSLTSLLLLTGCSCKAGLYGLIMTRKNSFFTDKELNKVHLNGLPKLEYNDSYLEVNGTKLTGYFNVGDGVLERYGEEILNYYKNSELTYGAIMDYGYMFGIPNIFDMMKTRDLCKDVKHLPFYKIYGDRYAFFYEVDEQFYEVLIRNEENTVNNKDYNFIMKVGKVSQVRWSTDYTESFVTDENLSSFVTGSHVDYYENYPDFAEIKLDYINLPYFYMDVHLLIDYTEFGVPGTRPCDTVSPNSIDNSCSFRRETGTYQEGDIEIKRVYVAKESAYITKKNTDNNTSS